MPPGHPSFEVFGVWPSGRRPPRVDPELAGGIKCMSSGLGMPRDPPGSAGWQEARVKASEWKWCEAFLNQLQLFDWVIGVIFFSDAVFEPTEDKYVDKFVINSTCLSFYETIRKVVVVVEAHIRMSLLLMSVTSSHNRIVLSFAKHKSQIVLAFLGGTIK